MTEKILALYACHTSSKKKYFSTLNNITFLENYYDSLVIINSNDAKYKNELKNDLSNNSKLIYYLETTNDQLLDFGKWIFALSNVNFNNYHHILLINDSIIVVNKNIIDFFYYYKIISFECKLYAYNDAFKNNNYYLPSYLILMNTSLIQNFIHLFKQVKNLIIDKKSYIEHFLYKIHSIHTSAKCFIQLVPKIKSDLFIDNESFYLKLIQNNIFHLIKHSAIEYYYKNNKLTKDNLLPEIYINFLKCCNINKFFCVSNEFNMNTYKNLNRYLIDKPKNIIMHDYYVNGLENNTKIINNNYIYFINNLFKTNINIESFPNDFNYKDFTLLEYNLKNNGILKIILYFYNNKIINYNINIFKKNIHKEYLKKIYPETFYYNTEKCIYFLYNKFKNITFQDLLDEFNIQLYKHFSKINSFDIDFIKYHYKIKGIFNKDFKIIDLSIYHLFYDDTKNFNTKQLMDHYLKIESKENKLNNFEKNFDPFFYKHYYFKEFQNFTNLQLKQHYIKSGYKEKRLIQLPTYFSIEFYKIIKNNDKHFNSNIKSNQDYILYYIKHDIHSDTIKKTFFNLYKDKKYKSIFNNLSIIPNNFNYLLYKNIYTDLKNLDEFQCKLHYIEFGKNENRICYLDEDFNINFYKYFNKDLNHLSDNNLIKHFILQGKYENRIYKIPCDFDIYKYKILNPDLKNISNDKLKDHYLKIGYKENRSFFYPDDFNPSSYKLLYKDLKNMNDFELISHYSKYGMNENRIYNLPNDFNIKEYKKFYNDVKNLSDEEAYYNFSLNYFDRIYKIPEDFNIENYKKLHFDLQFLSNLEIYNHFINYGIQEKRQYTGYNKYFKQENNNKVINNNNNNKVINNNNNTQSKILKQTSDNNDPSIVNLKSVQNCSINLNDLPDDFNPQYYKALNNDLTYFDNHDYLIKHYLTIGKYENRLYNIPKNFKIDLYRKLNPDVSSMNDEELKNHFINLGFKEGRLYNIPTDFDYDFYKNIYLNKKNISKEDIMNHYLDKGIKNKHLYKLPNDFNIKIFKKLNNDIKNLDDITIIKNFLDGKYKSRIFK